MKLIKLTEDHYIIVNNSEIKMDDYYLDDTNAVRLALTEAESYWTHRKHYGKVTHSTTPLEQLYSAPDGSIPYVYDRVQPLSLSEVKELLGEVDVEKKAEHSSELQEGTYTPQHKITYKHGYIDGYNQSLEDNKDKKYTEEDMRVLFASTLQNAPSTESHTRMISDREYRNFVMDTLYDRLILLFQPKTEWEVELVDNKLKLK